MDANADESSIAAPRVDRAGQDSDEDSDIEDDADKEAEIEERLTELRAKFRCGGVWNSLV